MNQNEVAELERLLSELADEGASRDLVQKVESMLMDQPELQDHYWSWMDVHVGLGVERTAILGERTGNSLTSLTKLRNELEARESQSSGPTIRPTFRKWLAPATAAVAACVALGFLVVPGAFWEHIASSSNSDSEAADAEETWRIPKITRVSWEGPLFAGPEHADSSATPVRAGLVSLGIIDGPSANAYILRLEPGASAELLMAADAYAENNLSVTELNSDGTPVLRNVSFNNFGAGTDAEPKNTRHYGLVGTWSVHNDTSRTKHYMINGIHKLDDPDLPDFDSDSKFLLSKLVVFLDEPDLVVIGWDDGGVDPNDEIRGVHADADGDYDDITVVIRISEADNQTLKPGKSHRIISWPLPSTETPRTDGSIRHQFSLWPGDITALKVASNAKLSNSFYLINVDSGEVFWSTTNTAPWSKNLGAVAIHNTGSTIMNLAVFSEHSDSPANSNDESKWKVSKMTIIHEQPSCAILGFEDLYDDSDFNDIRVTMLSVSSDRSNLIESPDGPFTDRTRDDLRLEE